MSHEDTASPLVERAEALLAAADDVAWPGESELDSRVGAIMAAIPPEDPGLLDLFLRFARPAAAVAAVAAVLMVGAAVLTGAATTTPRPTETDAQIADSDQQALDSASEVLALAEETSP